MLSCPAGMHRQNCVLFGGFGVREGRRSRGSLAQGSGARLHPHADNPRTRAGGCQRSGRGAGARAWALTSTGPQAAPAQAPAAWLASRRKIDWRNAESSRASDVTRAAPAARPPSCSGTRFRQARDRAAAITGSGCSTSVCWWDSTPSHCGSASSVAVTVTACGACCSIPRSARTCAQQAGTGSQGQAAERTAGGRGC